jgi:exonuclease III
MNCSQVANQRQETMSAKPLRLVTWNLNGVRNAVRKHDLEDFVKRFDIVCLQETKVIEEDIDYALATLGGYQSYWSSCLQKRYSGVVTYTKHTYVTFPIAHFLHGVVSSRSMTDSSESACK